MICRWTDRLLALVSIAALSACASVAPIEPDPLPDVAESATTSLLWSEDIGDGSKRAVVRFAPYVTDQFVFAVDASGTVSALDKGSGSRAWSVELGNSLTAGIGGDDDLLYAASANGEVYCLRQSDGSLVWQTRVSSEVIAAPVAGFDFVVVRSIDGRVYALDKQSGNRRWLYSYSVPALSLHGNGRPLVVPDGVVVGLDNGRLVALRGEDGMVFWENPLAPVDGRSEIDRLNDLDADPQGFGSSVYAVNYQGVVARIDPAQGQSLWTTKVSSSAGLAVTADLVVVTDEFDTVWGVRVADGSVAWKQESLSHRQLTAPVVTRDGVVVLGDYQGYLHLLSLQDGTLVGRIRAGSGQITGRPVLRDGVLYVQGRSGRVSAITL